MEIKDLHKRFKDLVSSGEAFMHERYKSYDIFIEFRELKNGVLTEDEEGFLINLLKDDEERWFVPNLLRTIDSFSRELMIELLETAIKIPDPSYNDNFIQSAVRVFDLEVNDYLNQRYLKANRDERIGILRAFYWVRDRRRNLIYSDGSEETYGAKYYWNGSVFFDREHSSVVDSSMVKMSSAEFEEYCVVANEKWEERIKLLLNEFTKEADLEMKYRIALNLPKTIEKYPESLQSQASEFLVEYREIPENISDLAIAQKIKPSWIRALVIRYLKWKGKRRQRRGLIAMKDR